MSAQSQPQPQSPIDETTLLHGTRVPAGFFFVNALSESGTTAAPILINITTINAVVPRPGPATAVGGFCTTLVLSGGETIRTTELFSEVVQRMWRAKHAELHLSSKV
jgi:hypothetical protein